MPLRTAGFGGRSLLPVTVKLYSQTVGATKTSEPHGRQLSTTNNRVNDSRLIAVLASDEVLRRRVATMLRRAAFATSSGTRGPSADAYVLAENGGVESSLAEIRRLHEEQPGVRIVAVVTGEDPRTWHRMLDAGADGVVPEARLEELLAATVTAACAGLVTLPRDERRAYSPALSTREKQVLGLVVLGLANGEIARKLHVAETTVKSHISSIFRKLGVRSRSEAAARVLDARSGLGLGILSISETEPA